MKASNKSTDQNEQEIFKELESLVDIAEVVLTEIPEFGGDLLRGVERIIQLTRLASSNQEQLLNKVKEVVDSYDEFGRRIKPYKDEEEHKGDPFL